MPSLCRDCLHMFERAPRCPACGSPRIVAHPELWDLSIAHMDCDAFYAAVEKRDAPELADKPVIVGGGRRGVVSTCCYVARTYGVRSAMPMFKALALCPEAVVVRPRFDAYVAVSRAIRAMMEELTPAIEPLSLDEAFLDVTGSGGLFGSGPEIAAAIRRDVLAATGLTVSVGVAPSKFVAKVASDLRKPDALVVVAAGDEERFLAPLPVARLWGAGRAAQEHFAGLGCRTIGDVQALAVDRLVRTFGRAMGAHFHAIAHGRDERAVVTARPPRSISRETTFERDVVEAGRCRRVLLTLAEDVGRRLRRQDLLAGTVRLKVRFPPFETHTRQTKLGQPSADDLELFGVAMRLLDRARPGERPVRLLGLGAADLVPTSAGGLFASPGDAVDRTLDAIRDRFGEAAVRHADAGRRREEEHGWRADDDRPR